MSQNNGSSCLGIQKAGSKFLLLGAPSLDLPTSNDIRESVKITCFSGIIRLLDSHTVHGQPGTSSGIPAKKFSAKTLEKAEWTFNDLLIPYIGSQPIRSITARDLLAVLRRLEARGRHETAHRTKQRASQVFRYAIATGRAERDPVPERRGMMQSWADYLDGLKVSNNAISTVSKRGCASPLCQCDVRHLTSVI